MIAVMLDVVGVRFSASHRGRKAEVQSRKPQTANCARLVRDIEIHRAIRRLMIRAVRRLHH
jgi:hypothetical protein